MSTTIEFLRFALSVITGRWGIFLDAEFLVEFAETEKGRTIFPQGLTPVQAEALMKADPHDTVPPGLLG